MARGVSLHIGLNNVDPSQYDGWDGQLAACEFDANDMQTIATSAGFTPTILLTQEATAQAVTDRIQSVAGELESGDIFFVTYSGHGGQVPDKNNEDEDDRSDETWVLFDRQLIDDELYALWKTFKPGVRILVLSDSCHSGSVTKDIDGDVPDVVATAEKAAQQSPRYRALPRDKMMSTYAQHAALYDGIQESLPNSKQSADEFGATVVLISGCQDDQLSRDGFKNGRFTEELLNVWDDGAWKGNYAAFHEKIRAGMPDDQQPNYFVVPANNPGFEEQEPFKI
jgi:hypothetical protein